MFRQASSNKGSQSHPFRLTASEGDVHEALAVIVATGAKANYLGMESEEKFKNNGVSACAVCDGALPRFRNNPLAVVGGGDSAIEAALSLAEQNNVMLSYRSEAFSRIKPRNRELIHKAEETGIIDIKYKSNLLAVEKDHITLAIENERVDLKNDLVYIFAGGELPTQFLEKAGVKITRRFGYTLKKHG